VTFSKNYQFPHTNYHIPNARLYAPEINVSQLLLTVLTRP